jgi:hypothetical protein
VKNSKLPIALSNTLESLTKTKASTTKTQAISRSLKTLLEVDTDLIHQEQLEFILMAYFSGQLQSLKQLNFLLKSEVFLATGVRYVA